MPLELIITPGDIAGVGPEVMLKAYAELLEDDFCEDAKIIFTGPKFFWQKLAEALDLPVPENYLSSPEIKDAFPEGYELGDLSADCGRFAMVCLGDAVRYCLEKPLRALVTAPLNKEGIRRAGYGNAGHTDFLAAATNSSDTAMAFYTEELKVVLVTHHIPLSQVPGALTTEGILSKIVQADLMGKKLGIEKPKIAVAGLNPHAGENGILGKEELDVIAPAIEDANIIGIQAFGPLPSDTLFHFAREKRYDIVVAMYHDQGLIPIKLLDFESGVNVTLGLPFVRTSPDHGTAYNIAEDFEADHRSALAAIKLACRLAKE
ncbi:4-hydroxythreonine-4-phosphate dehydrogenase PdxA [bacterium]|nr:4-hydroxythreonine-4-phosphate dehydrogenase PdxA [bacterium]